MEQLNMDQLIRQVERHHLLQLIHRCHLEQPGHDPWVWFLLRIPNQLLNEPF
jgi:hypothetical protein